MRHIIYILHTKEISERERERGGWDLVSAEALIGRKRPRDGALLEELQPEHDQDGEQAQVRQPFYGSEQPERAVREARACLRLGVDGPPHNPHHHEVAHSLEGP